MERDLRRLVPISQRTAPKLCAATAPAENGTIDLGIMAMVIKTERGAYQKKISPFRRLDGAASSVYSWEVVVRSPQWKVLGCGTGPSKAEARAAADSLIDRHIEIHGGAYDRRAIY